MAFLAVSLEKEGAVSNKTLREAGSQWPGAHANLNQVQFGRETLCFQVTQSLQ